MGISIAYNWVGLMLFIGVFILLMAGLIFYGHKHRHPFSFWVLGVLGAFIVAYLITYFIPNKAGSAGADNRDLASVMADAGDFIKENKQALVEASRYVIPKDGQAPQDIIATANGTPISLSELKLRHGLVKVLNKGADEKYDKTFNKLIEEKLLIKEAQDKGVLPTEQEILDYIEAEKAGFDNPEGQQAINVFMEHSGLTEDEYWNIYEYYNVARILVLQNIYTYVIENAISRGEIRTPETEKQRSGYWETHKLMLKNNAKVDIKDNAMLLKVDRDTLYLK